MATSLINYAFRAISADREEDFDTRLNIKQRRETILYKESSSIDKVNSSYIRGPLINSQTNFFINDLSKDIVENNNRDDILPSIFFGSSVELQTADFLITDQFTDEDVTSGRNPLFFKHQLNADNIDGGVVNDISLLNINLQQIVGFRDIKYDSVDQVVYSNLRNFFNRKTGEANAFYLHYTVHKPGFFRRTFVEILDSQPAFREATLADLDEFNQLVGQVYTVTETGGNRFEIGLPSNKFYAVQEIDGTKLRILPPEIGTSRDQWNVSIQNAQFFSRRQINPSTTQLLKYHLPDYLNQLFVPYFPYKTIANQEVSVVNKNLVKLDHDDILIDNDNNISIRLRIRDFAGNLKYAFSTNPNDEGVLIPDESISYTGGVSKGQSGDLFEDNGIRSVSTRDGYLDILDDMLIDDTAEADYVYKEPGFRFNLINFNPVQNRSVLDTYVVFYIKPGASLTKTLHYLIVEKDKGKVIATDDDTTFIDLNDLPTLINAGLLYYKELPDNAAPVISKVFLDEVSHLTVNSDQLFVLGEAYAGENRGPNDLAVFDARIPGGGIKDSTIEERPDLQFLERSLWDKGDIDGYDYPGQFAYVVELPCEVLKEHGGRFTQQQLKDITIRHAVSGSYNLLRFRGPSVRWETVESTVAEQVDLEWSPHVDPPATFVVEYSQTARGPWTVSDNSPTVLTTETVENLQPKTNWYFRVKIIIDDVDCGYTRTVVARPIE